MDIFLCSVVYIDYRQELMQDRNIEEKFQIVVISKVFKDLRTVDSPRVHWRKEERVIVCTRLYSLTCLRRIARRVGTSHEAMRKIRRQGRHPYKLYRVRELPRMDNVARRKVCSWRLRKLERKSHYLEDILFADESSSSRQHSQLSERQQSSYYDTEIQSEPRGRGLVYSISDFNIYIKTIW